MGGVPSKESEDPRQRPDAIASLSDGSLTPQTCLEQVQRLTQHWPQARVPALAPERWPQMAAWVTPEQRAIVALPREFDGVIWPRVEAPTGEVAA